jgi:hypothetical protein
MGIFSFFGKPDDDVEGSYSDRSTRSTVFFHKTDEIDEEIDSADERGDSVVYSEEDFDDKAINQRYDDDGREIEQGPKEYGPQKRWYQL